MVLVSLRLGVSTKTLLPSDPLAPFTVLNTFLKALKHHTSKLGISRTLVRWRGFIISLREGRASCNEHSNLDYKLAQARCLFLI